MKEKDQYAAQNAQVVNQLYEEEQKYRNLFQQSIHAIYVTNEHHQFLDANPYMLRLLSYDLGEIKQQALSDIFVQSEEYHYFVDILSEDGEVRNYETALRRKNGKFLECSLSATAIEDTDGNIQGFQGIIEDISDRKRVQQELIRLEKLVMTGNIARSIAHEVRNPLTNISLALEQFDTEEEDEESKIYLDIIKRNTNRINELVTAMLESSKPSKLDLQQQSLNAVIEEAVQLSTDRLRLQEVTLNQRYAQDMPNILLDKSKITMALLNIINNAVEAVERKQGIITIKTGEDTHYQYVQISDNGHGIATEDMGKLFDAFHTGKSGGMGLGLTATQNIINSHQAKISVDSTLEEGTTFTIAFRKELLDVDLRRG